MQELLKFVGLEGRLRLEWISSAEANKFVKVVTEFTEQIRNLGPNPLAKSYGRPLEALEISPLPWAPRPVPVAPAVTPKQPPGPDHLR